MALLAWVMVGLGAFAQALTGFGFSLVSAPFLLAAYEAPLGLQLNILLSVALNVGLVAAGRRDVDVRSVIGLLVPATVATVAVGVMLRHTDSRVFTIVGGSVCLAGTLLIWSGLSVGRPHGRVATAAVGAASGAMNVSAGIGGPPVVLFAVSANWRPRVARASLQAFFLGINAVALATLGLPRRMPIGLPVALVVGLVAGHVFVRRFEHISIRTLTLALAAAGSVLAIVRAVN